MVEGMQGNKIMYEMSKESFGLMACQKKIILWTKIDSHIPLI